MRKLLVLLTTLLFAYASLATAENEAIYELDTGLVEVPVLSVKGQPDKYSATFQQQDNGKLTFILTDTIPDPSVDSSINEAIYDQENGTIIIPALMIAGDEDLSDKIYFVELQEIAQQQTEESVFAVIQILDTSVQTTRALYGVSSSNATSVRCSGAPDQNLDVARQNFQTRCGEPWNDQKHVCDYKDADGFRCSGDVSASTTPDPTNPTTSNPPATNPDWCTGTSDRNRDAAKINFALACGQTWNDQLGHVCEWREPNEWHCRGTRSASAPPTTPRNVTAKHWTPRTVFINWSASLSPVGIRGYDVFRNGEKITTTVATEYRDRNGYGSPRYQIVAIGGDNIRSPSSSHVTALLNTGTLSRGDRTEAVGRVVRNGNEERRIQGFLIEREGNVAISAMVRDEQGNELGMFTQVYDDQLGEITVLAEPRYGEPKTFLNNNATAVADINAIPDEYIIGAYPGKPARTAPLPSDDDTDDGSNNDIDTDVDDDGIPDIRDPQIDVDENGPDPDCRNC